MKVVIDSDYFDKPETVRLGVVLGKGAALLPLRLRCRLAGFESGYISGLSSAEIEALAGWWGVAGKMVEAFEKVGIFKAQEIDGQKVYFWAESENIKSVVSTTKMGVEYREKEKADKEKNEKETSLSPHTPLSLKEKDKKENSQKEKENSCSKLAKKALFEIDKKTQYTQEFLQFWSAYPRKAGKAGAFRSWKAHKPNLKECVKALSWQVKSEQWTKDGGQFIPWPQTWINQERWLDEPFYGVHKAGTNTAPAGKYAEWEGR